MYYLIAALVSAAIGTIPLLCARKFVTAAAQGVATFFVGWGLFYVIIASTVYPLFGVVGLVTLLWLTLAALLASIEIDYRDNAVLWTWVFPIAVVVLYIGIAIANSPMFRSRSYASMISYLGEIEDSVWTDDVQPKDPAHMRMASAENASYQAEKVLGSAGAIGSQFSIGTMTVQKIGGELMFVAPLDFGGFSVWLNTDGAPGYIMVSGEDPHRQAELVQLPPGKRMRFTPGAFFGDDLDRHLRNHGYLGIGLTERTFEIDEEGNPWWVLTTFDPTIGWSGKRVTGVVVVDPLTGDDTFYKLGEVPEWVDRVIPDNFLENYFDWQGQYSSGWLNSWWGKKALTVADGAPLLIYGTNNQPEWVTDITSASMSDDSLVALVYTNSRTGKSMRYEMPGGGTTSAILDAVNKNQDIQFKHLHGAAVQIYNVNGIPTAVVPLLNESHAFQSVAMVSIRDIQSVASGRSAQEAKRNYEKLLTGNNRRATVEGVRDIQILEGVVSVVGTEVTPTQGTVYYLLVVGTPHLFTAGAESSPKLPVTREGHTVRIEFYASDQDVVSMHSFDNLSIQLSESPVQAEARTLDENGRVEQEEREETRTVFEELKKMDPKELKELLRDRNKN